MVGVWGLVGRALRRSGETTTAGYTISGARPGRGRSSSGGIHWGYTPPPRGTKTRSSSQRNRLPQGPHSKWPSVSGRRHWPGQDELWATPRRITTDRSGPATSNRWAAVHSATFVPLSDGHVGDFRFRWIFKLGPGTGNLPVGGERFETGAGGARPASLGHGVRLGHLLSWSGPRVEDALKKNVPGLLRLHLQDRRDLSSLRPGTGTAMFQVAVGGGRVVCDRGRQDFTPTAVVIVAGAGPVVGRDVGRSRKKRHGKTDFIASLARRPRLVPAGGRITPDEGRQMGGHRPFRGRRGGSGRRATNRAAAGEDLLLTIDNVPDAGPDGPEPLTGEVGGGRKTRDDSVRPGDPVRPRPQVRGRRGLRPRAGRSRAGEGKGRGPGAGC